MSDKRTHFHLLYATQQGNSKVIAENLHETILENDLKDACHVSCISELEKTVKLKQIDCLIIIGATTGDGDPPDTAKKIWRTLHKWCKEADYLGHHLKHLSYSVLGLGDTNYTNFCNFGKTIDEKLHLLGATRFYPCGWADDGTGLDVVVEPWLEGLVPTLRNHLSSLKSNNLIHQSIEEDLKEIDANKTSSFSKETELNSDIDGKIKTNEESEANYTKLKSNSINNQNLADKLITDNKMESLWEKFYSFDSVKKLEIIDLETIKSHPLRKSTLEEGSKLTVPAALPSYLEISFEDNVCDQFEISYEEMSFPSAGSNLIKANIISYRTLTNQGSLKKTLEFSLKLEDLEHEYEPGDSFAILCKNYADEVQCLIDLLDLNNVSDTLYNLSINSSTKKRNPTIPSHIPNRGTIRTTLTNCIDIRTIPKKTFLRVLCDYTSDAYEKRRIQELVSREGTNDYNDKVRTAGITILDFLIIFQSCKPPLTVLFEHCSRLLPRSYSITSSPLDNKNLIKFAFNVVEIKSENLTFTRKGICTGMLDLISLKDNLPLEQKISNLSLMENYLDCHIYFRNNTKFRLPLDNSVPIIMVGPGTGVAPFIGFLEHRKLQNGAEETTAETHLFFGCRNKELDFLYQRELEDHIEKKFLTKLYKCFSRDDSTGEKYVQDLIKNHSEKLNSLIVENNAAIYICGDAANMAKDVFDAFADVLTQGQDWSNLDARKYLADLQIGGRYLQDVWT